MSIGIENHRQREAQNIERRVNAIGKCLCGRKLIHIDRYTELSTDHHGQLWKPDICRSLAEGIMALTENGWPASFIFMYDEAWQLANSIAEFMKVCSN